MNLTPAIWPIKQLKEIAVHRMGGTPSTGCEEYWNDGDVLWATPSDLGRSEIIKVRNTARKITRAGLEAKHVEAYPAGTVLLSTTATIGNLGIADCPTYCNQQITAIIPNETVLSEYLAYYLLRSKADLMRLGGTSTATHINQKNLATLCVPVPPLDEQRHIVDILSRAEGLVRLRREAQRKAAEIIPALFLDMYGDPATNPKGWPILPVRNFVERFEGGKNLQAGEDGASEYRILKVSAVTSGSYIESEAKSAPHDYTPPKSYVVKKGDLLFSRANTEQLVGATALVDSTNGKTLLPDKLWRFVWSQPVSSLYMYALFQSRSVREELGRLSTGTSASMRNISQAKLFNLKLPIAPIEKQRQFAEQVEQIRSIQTQQSIAARKAETVFDALLARMFGIVAN
jgi:type I restriction enzyme, S subunit